MDGERGECCLHGDHGPATWSPQMAARALVERDVHQGARLLRAIDDAGIPIEAMFWILADAWRYWFLVVVVPTQSAEARHNSALQIHALLARLDDVDYLMDKVAVVQGEDWRYRAIRSRLRDGGPQSDYHLGGFYAEDLDVF